MSGEPDPEKPAAPSPGEHGYSGFGVRTRPAPPGTVAAINVVEATRLVEGLWPGEPEIEFRLVTTGDFCEPPPERLVDRPGWVFTYRGTTVVLHGRHGGHSSPAGVSTVIIDAATGALIHNGQSGDGPDR